MDEIKIQLRLLLLYRRWDHIQIFCINSILFFRVRFQVGFALIEELEDIMKTSKDLDNKIIDIDKNLDK